MKIEGVPEGWELVRIGKPKAGEVYVGAAGCEVSDGDSLFECYAIVRKIETTRPMTRDEFMKAWKERGWCPLVANDESVYLVRQVSPHKGDNVVIRIESFGWLTMRDAMNLRFASDNSPLTVTE